MQLPLVQRPHGFDGVGFRRALVIAVALDARKAQREAARVVRARLDFIERDLGDELRPHVHDVPVARSFE